jgi:hypothetical protein
LSEEILRPERKQIFLTNLEEVQRLLETAKEGAKQKVLEATKRP